jgi:phosphorylcholine metabolism protein LicD
VNSIQKKLLALMDEFNEICQKNNIEYFFAGGTALGAIRNGGFLPWDDDADVLIKRSEFEKLDKIMNGMSFENRAWITEDNNRTYLNPTARYFDLESTDILESRLDYGAPKGCQLEVFIMDPFPNTKEKQDEFIKHLWLYSEVSNPYILFGSLKMPAEMLDSDLYYRYKKRLETENVEDIKKEILDKITYSEDECDYWCGRWSCMPYVFKKEWMSAQKYVDFEGRSFPIPNGVLYEMVENYDANWDIVPPPAKQKIHPSIKSATKSYRDIEDKIRSWCDEVEYNKLLLANKEDRVERLLNRFEIEKSFASIRQSFLSQLAAELNKREWQFNLDNLQALTSEFEEYFLTQFKHSYKKYKLPVKLNEDLLETMLLTLIHSDKIEYANTLNEINRDSSIYNEYETICFNLGELKIKKYEGNVEQTRAILNTLSEYKKIAGQVETERANAWLESVSNEYSEQEIDEKKDRLANKEDLETLKYIGDMYEKAGAEEKAGEIYDKVISDSRNGMILYDLQKRGIGLKNESEETGNA